jgi:hypothetical protein
MGPKVDPDILINIPGQEVQPALPGGPVAVQFIFLLEKKICTNLFITKQLEKTVKWLRIC